LNDKSIYEADLVLFGGGTLFDFRDNDAAQAAYRYRLRNVVIFGSGVQDFADAPMTGDGYNTLGQVAQSARWIGVRGPISQACFLLVGRNNVYMTGDPMFLHEPKRFREGNSKRIALQFGVPSHSFDNLESLSQQIQFIVKGLREEGAEPVFVSVWGRDLVFLENVNRQFKLGLDIVAPGEFHEMVEVFADFGASITNRLHGGLASLMVGCPTVMIAHQTKTYDAALSLVWKPFFPCDWPPLAERVSKVALSLTGMDMGHYLEHIENFRQAQRKYLDGIISDYLTDPPRAALQSRGTET